MGISIGPTSNNACNCKLHTFTITGTPNTCIQWNVARKTYLIHLMSFLLQGTLNTFIHWSVTREIWAIPTIYKQPSKVINAKGDVVHMEHTQSFPNCNTSWSEDHHREYSHPRSHRCLFLDIRVLHQAILDRFIWMETDPFTRHCHHVSSINFDSLMMVNSNLKFNRCSTSWYKSLSNINIHWICCLLLRVSGELIKFKIKHSL